MVLPSKLVLSGLYQLLDLALKSPIIVIRKEHVCARVSNPISKLSERFQTDLETGLGTKITRFITSRKLKIQTFF